MAPIERAGMGKSLWSMQRSHGGALLVGALFVLFSLYYNVTIPLWESDSEWAHYHYVRYIQDNKALPTPQTQFRIQDTADPCAGDPYGLLTPNLQFRQPPLYYLLGAAFSSWVDAHDGWQIVTNPHVFTDPTRAGVNVAVHSAAEGWATTGWATGGRPYAGTVLAVHVLRLMSGLFGLLGLVAAYLTGRLFFPGKRQLATAVMALNAFIPQYVFSSSVVNNDILAGALGSWCVFFCASALLRKPRVGVVTPQAGTPSGVMLAVATAFLATAAKYTALPLIPFAGLATAASLVRAARGDRSAFSTFLWRVGLVIVALVVPVVVWWGRVKPLTSEFLTRFLPQAGLAAAARAAILGGPGGERYINPGRAGVFSFMTFWGLFGNDDLALPRVVLIPLAVVALVAIAGLVRYLVDRREPPAADQNATSVRALVIAALALVLVAWAISAFKSFGTSEPRGRYLLPVYSTVSLLLVLGLYRALPTRLGLPGVQAVCGSLLALTLVAPLWIIQPAYAPPPLARSAALLPGEEPIKATFGGFAELVGYHLEPARIGLFDRLTVTLVWHAVAKTSHNYTLSLHLLDGADRSLGAVHSYPGHGNYATSLWQPGDIFRDTYALYLGPSARGHLPSLGRVKVAFHCYGEEGDAHLQVTDAQGDAVGDAVYLGRIKLAASQADATSPEAGVDPFVFGDEIALKSYTVSPPGDLSPGQDLAVELRLQALAQPRADYTAFAHLVNAQGETVAGNDQPLTGMYYPSGLWEAGEEVSHVQKLHVPDALLPGEYTLFMGLYNPQTGVRLPIRDAFGTPMPGDQFPVITFSTASSQLSDPLGVALLGPAWPRLAYPPAGWRTRLRGGGACGVAGG